MPYPLLSDPVLFYLIQPFYILSNLIQFHHVLLHPISHPIRVVHPPKPIMHIAYSPYFHKIYKCPPIFVQFRFSLFRLNSLPPILIMTHLCIVFARTGHLCIPYLTTSSSVIFDPSPSIMSFLTDIDLHFYRVLPIKSCPTASCFIILYPY